MKTILNLVDEGHQWDFHGGIFPPSRKERTKDCAITAIPMPAKLYIPVAQHVGQPALPMIQAGESVTQGQLLARKEAFISANIIAPADGTISEISDYAACHPSGLPTQTMVLETAKKQKTETLPLLTIDDDKSLLLQRISACGITGLGGASFPTAVKLAPNKPIEYLIINAAECEPYITADDALMRERASDIINGIKVMQKLLSPTRTIIAIEDNKPQAIKQIEQAADESIIVRSIPTVYPAGGEKQLIEVITSLQVPSGKIPADIGIVVQNVATSYAAGNAVLKGEPLVSRIVTVSGDLVNRPGNYEVPLGMSIKDLLDQCGFQGAKRQKIIVGGPMMGFALNDINAPVVKATNCIIAASDQELPNPPPEQNCIRCGDCEQVCPAQLLPQQLQWFAKDQDHDKLKQHDLFDCIECGACAYVCPSSIPLVQYYRVAKAEIRSEEREKQQAQRAKERFEQRTARLEREKLEREERNRLAAEKRKAAMKGTGNGDAIAAALARVKAKKNQTQDESAAPNDRVAAAIARAKAKKAASQAPEPQQTTVDDNQLEQKSRVADAIARAKAKKLAAQQAKDLPADDAPQATAPATPAQSTPSPDEAKKARVAAAVAKAKAKKQAAAQAKDAPQDTAPATPAESTLSSDEAKKARVAAAVAKAKAKKQAATKAEGAPQATAPATPAESTPSPDEAKKARVAAAVAKAKAKKQATAQAEGAPQDTAPATPAESTLSSDEAKKARVAAAVAKAKAKKQTATKAEGAPQDTAPSKPAESTLSPEEEKKARIAKAVAKAKANALEKKNLENKDN